MGSRAWEKIKFNFSIKIARDYISPHNIRSVIRQGYFVVIQKTCLV